MNKPATTLFDEIKSPPAIEQAINGLTAEMMKKLAAEMGCAVIDEPLQHLTEDDDILGIPVQL